VIIAVVAILDLGPGISLDLAVNKIFLVAFLDPMHLIQYSIKEIICELMIIGDVVRLVIDKSMDVKIRLPADELNMFKFLPLNMWKSLTKLSDD
jgi:hypothetical protein